MAATAAEERKEDTLEQKIMAAYVHRAFYGGMRSPKRVDIRTVLYHLSAMSRTYWALYESMKRMKPDAGEIELSDLTVQTAEKMAGR